MDREVDLNWQGEFASPVFEHQFQTVKWSLNANRMKFVCSVSALIYLAAAYTDYLVLGLAGPFFILLTFRVLTASAGMANFLLAFRREPFPQYAYTIAGYMVMVCISESLDAALKFQAIGSQMIPFTVIIILAFYLFLPVRTYPTFAAAVFGSVLYASTLMLFTGIYPEDMLTVLLFLILVNAFGLYFLISFSGSQRKEYLSLREEQRLNEELKSEVERRKQVEAEQRNLIKSLQRAMDEVKTLWGLIPICANCKKIRDDEGFWKQLEEYIQEHSSAKFSHGICPDCARKLYPEIYDKLGSGRSKLPDP